MATTYSPINIYNYKRRKVNAEVYIVEQTDTLKPDNSETSGSLKAVQDDSWHCLAAIDTFKVTPETETDEITYCDPQTHSRVKDPQEDIVRRNIEMTAVDYSVLLNAVSMGVPNPTGAEAAAQLSAGNEDGAPLFVSNNPNVPVGVRVDFYDNNATKMQTFYFYANLKATGETSYDGKTLKPTINLEVQQSVHNRMMNTAAFTQQTESNG